MRVVGVWFLVTRIHYDVRTANQEVCVWRVQWVRQTRRSVRGECSTYGKPGGRCVAWQRILRNTISLQVKLLKQLGHNKDSSWFWTVHISNINDFVFCYRSVTDNARGRTRALTHATHDWTYMHAAHSQIYVWHDIINNGLMIRPYLWSKQWTYITIQTLIKCFSNEITLWYGCNISKYMTICT